MLQLSGVVLGVKDGVGVWVEVREAVGVVEGDAPCDSVGVGVDDREGALHEYAFNRLLFW